MVGAASTAPLTPPPPVLVGSAGEARQSRNRPWQTRWSRSSISRRFSPAGGRTRRASLPRWTMRAARSAFSSSPATASPRRRSTRCAPSPRAFFDLPHWEKLRVKMPTDRYRGLMTVGSEDVAYSMEEDEGAPDWRESFVTGPHDHAYDEYHYGPEGWRFFTANLWPDRPAEMRPLWEAYYRENGAAGRRLDADFRLRARALRRVLRRQDRQTHHQLHRLLLPAATDGALAWPAPLRPPCGLRQPHHRHLRHPPWGAFRSWGGTAPGPTCLASPAPSSSISAT